MTTFGRDNIVKDAKLLNAAIEAVEKCGGLLPDQLRERIVADLDFALDLLLDDNE